MELKTLKPVIDLKIMKGAEGECWHWLGTVRVNGYGQLEIDGKTRAATRVVWEIYRGPIPRGRRLRHTCATRDCVNPDHLKVGGSEFFKEERFRTAVVKFKSGDVKRILKGEKIGTN